MIKNRKLYAATILIVAALILAACNNSVDSRFIGIWEGMTNEISMLNIAYEFHQDGTGIWRDGRPASSQAVGETPSNMDISNVREILLGGSSAQSTHALNEIPINWEIFENRLEILFENSTTPLIYYFEFLDGSTLVITREDWPQEGGLTLTRVE